MPKNTSAFLIFRKRERQPGLSIYLQSMLREIPPEAGMDWTNMQFSLTCILPSIRSVTEILPKNSSEGNIEMEYSYTFLF